MTNQDDYLEFVQNQANKLGKTFMLGTGEGNDFEFEDKGWYVEELSGWLIDYNEKEAFLEARDNEMLDEQFTDCYVWVKWRLEDNELLIEFEKVEVY